MAWNPDLPHQIEQEKIKYDIVPYTRGRVLNLGCGLSRLHPHFVGVDNMMDWPAWADHTPDVYMDCSDVDFFTSQSCDAVFSSWLLQYFEDPEPVLKNWWRIIKNGGHLILYLPHRRFYPNIGQAGASPKHKIDFLPEDVISAMEKVGGWNLVVNEDRNGDTPLGFPEYSFLQVYEKRADKEQNRTYKKDNGKTCAVVRYGGCGDMLQTSSVLPRLKEQGYHVTLITNEEGFEVIKLDPHVDEFIVQGRNQVPIQEVWPYWNTIRTKYDKFINFSESVEGTFLTIHDRVQFDWPHELRHKMLNVNYLEFMHELAGVPYKSRPKFYAHHYEKLWAKKQRKKLDAGRVILWVLSGSSIHKNWPYLDQAIARILLTYSDVKVVFCGDPLSEILEAGWENESRIKTTCGKWDMRNSLVFATECADLVIGPETGVMNAVAMMDVPKIVYLSHSSVENLTRDWKNTVSLTPDGCECFPCHKLHEMGWDTCNKDEKTGVALCQARIDIEDMWKAIKEKMNGD
jgi:ADP-heptose:LPS heptosyltransferase/predicted SAM-dependent methyltransferase